jgi:hypothetical protein
VGKVFVSCAAAWSLGALAVPFAVEEETLTDAG